MVKKHELEKVKAYIGVEGDYITLKEGEKLHVNVVIEILRYSLRSDLDIIKALKGAKISLRKGIILLIEEKLQSGKKVDYLNDLNDFVHDFYERFNPAQRRIIFKDLYEIHPPDPCNRYEGKNSWLYQYAVSLESILSNSSWLIEDYKVEKNLKYILEDVILCKG